MADSPFSLFTRDPETGLIPSTAVLTGLTSRQIADTLSHRTGYEIHRLDGYAVIDERDDATVTAEEFLEHHAADAVIAAWAAGTPKAASIRRQKLHEWWPALATALDALEANGA